MATTIGTTSTASIANQKAAAIENRPACQAYQILHIGFTAAPIIAGLDKFFNVLTDWTQYLAPVVTDVMPASTFMMIVGVIEVVAGIGVAVKPRLFSYVVALWLLGIIVNLLILGNYFDVALRDFGLMLGALALGRLAGEFGNGWRF